MRTVVIAVYSQLSALSSSLWSDCNLPWNFVSGHVLTTVCGSRSTFTDSWSGKTTVDLQDIGLGMTGSDLTDHVWWGRWKHGCLIVWSVTIIQLTTEADNQYSVDCVSVLTDVMSNHISLGWRHSKVGGPRRQHTLHRLIWTGSNAVRHFIGCQFTEWRTKCYIVVQPDSKDCQLLTELGAYHSVHAQKLVSEAQSVKSEVFDTT